MLMQTHGWFSKDANNTIVEANPSGLKNGQKGHLDRGSGG